MSFLQQAINNLRIEREAFHSEDDLKFALSFVIKQQHPDWQIRLERPISIGMKKRNGEYCEVRAPIDIIVIDDNKKIVPIELKYKTRKTKFDLTNGIKEAYELAEHGAHDAGRYSFRKDIYRVEQFLTTNKDSDIGFIFILTNDFKYQENIAVTEKIDRNFSFHMGAEIKNSDDSWHYKSTEEKYELIADKAIWKKKNEDSKYHWTCTKDYFYKLDLNRSYNINWQEYSRVKDVEFKYCLIEVRKPIG